MLLFYQMPRVLYRGEVEVICWVVDVGLGEDVNVFYMLIFHHSHRVTFILIQ